MSMFWMVQPRRGWETSRRCSDWDPDFFFAEGAEQQKATLACAGCPVRGDCLATALKEKQEHGVWGGTTERQRTAYLTDADVADSIVRGGLQLVTALYGRHNDGSRARVGWRPYSNGNTARDALHTLRLMANGAILGRRLGLDDFPPLVVTAVSRHIATTELTPNVDDAVDVIDAMSHMSLGSQMKIKSWRKGVDAEESETGKPLREPVKLIRDAELAHIGQRKGPSLRMRWVAERLILGGQMTFEQRAPRTAAELGRSTCDQDALTAGLAAEVQFLSQHEFLSTEAKLLPFKKRTTNIMADLYVRSHSGAPFAKLFRTTEAVGT